jgi:hypothetical protein
MAVAAVFFGSLFVYIGDARPHPEVDCAAAPYMAWSIVRHGSLDLRYYPDMKQYLGNVVREMPDGSWLSMRSPGSAIAAVPFILPLALTRDAPPSAQSMHQLGKLSAAVSVAWAAGLFFVVCRRLAPTAAWPATVLFALGTCLSSVASQALWMHGPATFWLCLALYLLTAPVGSRFAGNWLAGLAFGLAILTRPTTAFFGAATGLACLAQRRWSAAAGLLLGVIGPLAYYFWLNEHQFGHALLGGYADDDWSASPPLWMGFSGLLAAPSRGMLVYSPALLLVPLGVYLVARRKDLGPQRGLIAAWFAAAVATILFYARWHDWRGGWCYGPRFLCETMPLFCLLFAVGYDGLPLNWSRLAARGLVAASVGVHLVGLFGYGKGYVDWHNRHDLYDDGKCLWALRDTQIEAHVRFVVREAATRLSIVPRTDRPAPQDQHHATHPSDHPPNL